MEASNRVTFLRSVILLALCVTSVFAAAENQKPTVETLLENVALAIKTQNYRGRVTFEHSGTLEIIEIAHFIKDDIVYEHVNYLNGRDRGVYHATELHCHTVGSQLMGGEVVARASGRDARIEKSYHQNIVGLERVAGRDSWVVQFVPKDQHRHGVILAVDVASYLPTRILIVANGRKVLERMHFVSLESSLELSSFSDINDELPVPPRRCPLNQPSPIAKAAWQPEWLPPGFILARSRYTPEDGHMDTYTDGIAAFTIFSKATLTGDAERHLLPMSTRYKHGATVIVTRLDVENNGVSHLSVLGEIPSDTANQVLASLRDTRS